MIKLGLLVSLLFAQFSIAQEERASDTLEIWTVFSTGNFINQNAEKIVSENWPFIVKGIAGDVFSEQLIDSLKLHNQKVWNYLDSIGRNADSKKSFEAELRKEIDRIKKAVEISRSNKVVSALYESLRKKSFQDYTELSKVGDFEYEFKIYSFNLNNLDEDQDFELKFVTDIKNEITRIIK